MEKPVAATVGVRQNYGHTVGDGNRQCQPRSVSYQTVRLSRFRLAGIGNDGHPLGMDLPYPHRRGAGRLYALQKTALPGVLKIAGGTYVAEASERHPRATAEVFQ
jgi:hypothetical protein